MSVNITLPLNNASGLCLDVFINESDTYRRTMNLVLIAMNTPFSVFAVLINALIIFVIVSTKQFQTPPNVLLCSIAVTDLLTGASTQPLMIVWRVLLQFLGSSCEAKVVHFWYVAFLYTWTGGKFANLALISCDRLMAVSQPLKYSNNITSIKVVQRLAFMWFFWVVFLILKYFIFTENISQTLTTALSTTLVGFLVISQVATIYYIKKNNIKIVAEHNARIVYERERRASFTVMTELVAVIVFLLPSVIVQTVVGFSSENQGIIATNFAILAMLMNSSVSPLIYLWRNREIRKGCQHVFTYCHANSQTSSDETPRTAPDHRNVTCT